MRSVKAAREIKVKAASCVSGDSKMILTYHVTEQSWGKPKLRICWQGKERRKKKKKKMAGRSKPAGEEIKRERERQASFRKG